MPRYIDADKLEEWVYAFHLADAYWAIPMLRNAPTADVVPKSEVDLYRKQVDELEDELSLTYDKLEKAKAEVEKIIEEAFKMMQDNFVNTPIYKVFPSDLKAELKKKYLGGDD